MKITEFFNTEFANFATYSAFRGIACVVDGAKPSSRKVICAVKNLKEKTKVSSLASRIVDTLEYIHGAQSLEGVISGMAQNFAGSNNINLLEPKGDFGSVCIQKAGAGRYICVNKEKIYDYIFNSDDDKILIEQEFEGTRIEPKFYVPIIPMILVNGSEGIGTGFAQKILPRDVKEIIQYIIHRIGNKPQKYTLTHPYFNGFTGTVKAITDSSFEIYGKFERTNSTTITVTELPITYDIEKYCSILSELEDAKVIMDYTDKSEPKQNRFCFEIKAPREFVKKDDDYIFDKLKLIKKITENYTCIGKNNEIVEFKSVQEILDYYVSVRLEYYAKRKEYIINRLKEELMIAGSKYYFVNLILKDMIKVFRVPKADVHQCLEYRSEFPFHKVDDSFNYLTNMPIHSFSPETLEELKDTIQKKKLQLKEAQEKTIEQMWLDELKLLKEKL
jgi:DNA topoisomerase-2